MWGCRVEGIGLGVCKRDLGCRVEGFLDLCCSRFEGFESFRKTGSLFWEFAS